MKIVKKRGIKRIKINHNRKIFWIILGFIVLLAIVIWMIVKDRNEIKEVVLGDICLTNSDCVPSGCCHPSECTIKERAPKCEGMFCSAVCSGPLDCGAGSCGCVNNKCVVVKK